MPDRITFSTALGSVLATAGVAIGVGNVWRFPYMMGKYGGSAFLLMYVLTIVAFAIPALMAEWALGRHTRHGPVGAFRTAGMPGARLLAALVVLSVFMAASYYGVVLAWVLGEAVSFAGAGGRAMSAPPGAQIAYVAITVGLAGGVILLGVRKGIERASIVCLPVFFVLFTVLIVRSLTLPGAMDGLIGFLALNLDDIERETPLAALGQAFFSVGLGGTLMVTYGSYLRSKQAIPGAAVGTVGADLAAALMAGLVVVPAAVAVGVPLASGPPLMFDVMPSVFAEMTAGGLFGVLFFVSVFLVGLLSLIAAYEVVIDAASSTWGWSRRLATVTVVAVQAALALPALLLDGYIGFSDLLWGTTMQPFGSAVAIVVAAWCVGRARLLEEIARGSSLPVPAFLYYWLKYVVPAGIAAVLVHGWSPQLLAWLGRG